MLPFFVNYLHVKNIRKQLIPNRGINDKRILNLIGWEHFRSYLKKQFFPRYETFAESKSAQLCTIFNWLNFWEKPKKPWPTEIITFWPTDTQSISPYSVRMWENTDQKNSQYGQFSFSVRQFNRTLSAWRRGSKN